MFGLELVLSAVATLLLLLFLYLNNRIKKMEVQASFSPIHLTIQPRWRLILIEFFRLTDESVDEYDRVHQEAMDRVVSSFSFVEKTYRYIDYTNLHDCLPAAFNSFYPLSYTILRDCPSLVYAHSMKRFQRDIYCFEDLQMLEVEELNDSTDEVAHPNFCIDRSDEGFDFSIFTHMSRISDKDGKTKLATIPRAFIYDSFLPPSVEKNTKKYFDKLAEFGWTVGEDVSSNELKIHHKYFSVTISQL
jgi:hypothetical protein